MHQFKLRYILCCFCIFLFAIAPVAVAEEEKAVRGIISTDDGCSLDFTLAVGDTLSLKDKLTDRVFLLDVEAIERQTAQLTVDEVSSLSDPSVVESHLMSLSLDKPNTLSGALPFEVELEDIATKTRRTETKTAIGEESIGLEVEGEASCCLTCGNLEVCCYVQNMCCSINCSDGGSCSACG